MGAGAGPRVKGSRVSFCGDKGHFGQSRIRPCWRTSPCLTQIETTAKAIRTFIAKLGGTVGLAVSYEAGPGGFALWRLLTGGRWSVRGRRRREGRETDRDGRFLSPRRVGRTDSRTQPHRGRRSGSPKTPSAGDRNGHRHLLRCRDDIRCARTAARRRVVKQLGRHHRIYRERTTT